VHVRPTESLKHHRSRHLEPLGSRAKPPAVSRGSFLPIVSSSSTSENPSRAEKRELRRILRARRRALPRWVQQRAARRMVHFVLRQSWYRRARTVAAYLANDGEIDPFPLLEKAYAAGKRILLPRLRQKRLEFVVYRPRASMRRNRFNIPEPIGAAVPVQQIHVVCVPLVGFDRQGRRLGMGGGFYDRTFARGAVRARINQRAARSPRLIGLAYACQEVTQLPHEAWDVRLAGVITERESIRANGD
jgi:5-formyltetrahydrofolate cyclo-ligase